MYVRRNGANKNKDSVINVLEMYNTFPKLWYV